MIAASPTLTWLTAGQAFPKPGLAWGAGSPAPGLLAAGGSLDAQTLCEAYRQGIFPWSSARQPTLWWSPDPRMVLRPSQFQLHASLKKTLRRFSTSPDRELRFNTAFDTVIEACASSAREGQGGTWVLPSMIDAYSELHRDGLAHSVETWVGEELVGGLYCVALGKAVFGESMFSRTTDASKIALAGLVSFCLKHGISQIDCQQNTRHLASLGAQEMSRAAFMEGLAAALAQASPAWVFDKLDWQHLIPQAPA